MYYGGICDSDKCFCLSNCLLALSISQPRCVMYNMTNFGQINNFIVLVLVCVFVGCQNVLMFHQLRYCSTLFFLLLKKKKIMHQLVKLTDAIWLFTAGNLFPSHSCIGWPESSPHWHSRLSPQIERQTIYQSTCSTYLTILICILPWWRCRKPPKSIAHCRTNAATNMFKPIAPNPYFLRNVIRKPKPMNIITCTSWNTGNTENGEKVTFIEQ